MTAKLDELRKWIITLLRPRAGLGAELLADQILAKAQPIIEDEVLERLAEAGAQTMKELERALKGGK